MVTASGDQQKVVALESGADDFIAKPVNQASCWPASRSLLRIKSYHDTISAQTAELAEWNRTLEQRVEEQLAKLERVGPTEAVPRRLSLPSSLATPATSRCPAEPPAADRHRVHDLRGFTAFSETAEPEEVMSTS